MHINKIGFLFSLACWLVLLAPITTLGVPVPPLESHTQTAWKNAWEDAWQIAWESAWKSVYSADVPAEKTQSCDAGIWDFPPNFEGELAGFDFDVVWGAPLEAGLDNFSNAVQDSTAMALEFSSAEAGQQDQGKLYIQVQPADAEIVLRGADKPFSQGMFLEPGTYIVDILRPGYLVQTRRIDLLSGMAATLDVSLTPEDPANASVNASTNDSIDTLDQAAENTQAPEAATQAQLYKNLLTPAASESSPETAELPASAEKTTVAPAVEPEQKQGSLYVSTEPADATIRILRIKPIFHQGIQLAPGRYTIDAASDGFEKSVATVEITPDQETRIHLALEQERPKAKLFVQTEPAGATVRILNIKPVFHQGIELKHGEYLLDAQLDGYKTTTQTIQLVPGEEKNITLNLPKAPPMGRLYVDASPAEAKIRILDIRPKFEQGLKLEEGEYTIDAQLDGFRTEIRKVRIVPGGDTRVSLQLTEAEEKGRLFVQTEPAGAAIRILNIKPKFEQGMELDQGEYTIDAQLDGYRTEVQKVSVAPGQDKTIKVQLAKAPEKGKLFVTTEPNGATIRLLHIKPVFHQGIELIPGSYTIDAHLDGHETAVEHITIAPQQETHISLTLAQTLQPEPVATQPVPAALPVPQVQQPAEVATPAGLPQKDVAGYDVEAFVSMAVLAINSGNYDDAIHAGDKALALDSNCAEALKIKGDAYLLMEEYDNAIAQYDRSLTLSDDQQTRVNRAYAFEQLEKEIKLLKAAKNVKQRKASVPHQFALDN